MTQGPNVKKLIVHKMTLTAVPPGCGKGGLAKAVDFLSNSAAMLTACREATAWVEAAITAVRQAADPNPWRESSDEEIAAEVLRGIEARKAKV